MPRALCLVLALLPVIACEGQNLLKNGDFARPSALSATAPADWTLPDGGPWALAAGKGPDGSGALRYEGDGAAAQPAHGPCDFLAPGGAYELRWRYRTEGNHSPVVRVMDTGRREEVALVELVPNAAWTEGRVVFRTATADAAVELYADKGHARGQRGPAGKVWFAAMVVTVQAGADDGKAPIPDLGENLALGKPYTMTPPNYGLCADAGDTTQLTDGAFTEGYFWTQPTTVGWAGSSVSIVTVDLGQDYPIKGVAYSTAAGVAGVRWPKQVRIYCSADGKSWGEAGELVDLYLAHSKFPPVGVYAARKLWTDKLRTHGRYVAFAVEPETVYAFVDEVEVYRGDEALPQATPAVQWEGDLQGFLDQRVIDTLIADQLRRDLRAVQADIEELPAYKITGPRLQAEVIADAIGKLPPQAMEGYRAVVPLNDPHRDIFRLQASVWRAQGKPRLRFWTKHRWDMLEPGEEPVDRSPASVTVHMMSNETRAGVLNITNAGEGDAPLRLRITGLPGGANPDFVKVHEVLCVGTRRFVAVSAALPELRRVGTDYRLTVPCGMTRQVWLSFHPENLKPGAHRGTVEVRTASEVIARIPLTLTVYPFRFPEETTLLCGGWEYTDLPACYGITVENKQAVIDYLREHYVNAPWATGGAMPLGQYNSAGQMTAPPDTAAFDNWVRRWPKAKMYLVFNSFTDSLNGEPMGTPAFNAMVGEWARFWAGHMQELGLKPSQLGLLIYDEPSMKGQYDIIVAWARAIEAAAPELVTWEDPQPSNDQDCLEMFAAVDALCPIRASWLAREQGFRDMFLQKQLEGKELWFYNADGPARSFDPFSYYLLQAWQAFQVGAKGSNFWAFGDSGGVSCWNEYPAQGNGPYCPMYLDDISVTGAKWMEAVREGIGDFEYLTMLRRRIEVLEKQGVAAAKLAKARQLLRTGPERVLAGETGANYRWDEKKDRSVQDQVRVEVLRALTELAK